VVSDSQIISAPPRRRARWPLVVGGMILGLIIGVLLIPFLAARAVLSTPLGRLLNGRSTRIDTSSASVVDKIRQLNRLESVDYSIDKIVEGNHQAQGLPDFLAGDRLLLIAHGEVIAGVDLSRLDPKAVQVNGNAVHVRLPEPQVLVTRIDNTRTRVYERTTGILVPTDPNLETQVRQAAEQQITQAAIDDKILDKARQNARVSVTGLLYALGFHTVDVQ
jgi:hypothetical protein